MILKLEDNASYWTRVRKWHKWFAWYPVWVDHNRFAWLQLVERRVACSHTYSDTNCCHAFRTHRRKPNGQN